MCELIILSPKMSSVAVLVVTFASVAISGSVLAQNAPFPSARPTTSFGQSFSSFTCDPFSASATDSAVANTVDCTIRNVCPGVVLTIGDCSSRCNGDQYIRLLDSHMIEVASNDNGCDDPFGQCSSMQYTFNGVGCQDFTLRQGCADNGVCSGRIKVLYTYTVSPTSVPTVIPTNYPTALPSRTPTTSPTAFVLSSQDSFCATYQSMLTNNARANYATCQFELCPGTVVTIGDCTGSCVGDQFIRLYDFNDRLVSYDDDGCDVDPYSACSQLTYVYRTGVCQMFSLRQGCFDNDSCAGTMSVVRRQTATPTSLPTATPSYVPSAVPTIVPTTQPSSIPTTLPSSIPTPSPTQQPLTGFAVTDITDVTPVMQRVWLRTKHVGLVYQMNDCSYNLANDADCAAAYPDAEIVEITMRDGHTVKLAMYSEARSPSTPPTVMPTTTPTLYPTAKPSVEPTLYPTSAPTVYPTGMPTRNPTTAYPTRYPTLVPTLMPSSFAPSFLPSVVPSSDRPTSPLTLAPTNLPSLAPISSAYPTTLPTAANSPTFTKMFGSSSFDYANSVAVDAALNSYVCGSFSGPSLILNGVSYPNTYSGTHDIFVIKFNSLGTLVWIKIFGTTDNEICDAIALDSTQSYLYFAASAPSPITIGGTLLTPHAQDILLVKLEVQTGNVVWAKIFGGSGNDWAVKMAIDTDGNILLTGNTQYSSTFTFGPSNMVDLGLFDVIILKVSPDGIPIWGKRLGGNSNDSGYGVAVDRYNNYFVAFDFYGTITIGSTTYTAVTMADVVIMKLDVNGNILWSRVAGGDSYDSAGGVGVDSNGNVIFSFASKSRSITIGARTFASTSQDGSRYVMFVIKVDANGNVMWGTCYNGVQQDDGFALTVDSHDNIYVLGFFSETISVGSYTLTGLTATSTFVVKVSPVGSVLWASRIAETAAPYIRFKARGNMQLDGYDNLYIAAQCTSNVLASSTSAVGGSTDVDACLVKVTPA